MVIHTKETRPRELQACRLTQHVADVVDFAARHMLLVRYRPSGKIDVTDLMSAEDPLIAKVGDWIVLDNGLRIVPPVEFEQLYTAEEEVLGA